MPIIHVELVEGRSVEQKRKLAKIITEATAETMGCPMEAVKVIYRDMKATDFAEGGILRSDK